MRRPTAGRDSWAEEGRAKIRIAEYRAAMDEIAEEAYRAELDNRIRALHQRLVAEDACRDLFTINWD